MATTPERKLLGVGRAAPPPGAPIKRRAPPPPGAPIKDSPRPKKLFVLPPSKARNLIGVGGQGAVFELSTSCLFKKYTKSVERSRLKKIARLWTALYGRPCQIVLDDSDCQEVIVIPWIKGTPLLEWVRSNPSRVLEIVDALLELGRSLNIVHNDLKPSNVLVQEPADGHIRVCPIDLDMGIDPEYTGPSTPAYCISKKSVRSGNPRDKYALAITVLVAVMAALDPSASEEALLAHLYGLAGAAWLESESVLFLTKNGPKPEAVERVMAPMTEGVRATVRRWLALG